MSNVKCTVSLFICVIIRVPKFGTEMFQKYMHFNHRETHGNQKIYGYTTITLTSSSSSESMFCCLYHWVEGGGGAPAATATMAPPALTPIGN